MDTMTMTKLDSEVAEYLPAREVMWSYGGSRSSQKNVAIVGSGDGNTSNYQGGLINVNVQALNGSGDGNFDYTSQHNFMF